MWGYKAGHKRAPSSQERASQSPTPPVFRHCSDLFRHCSDKKHPHVGTDRPLYIYDMYVFFLYLSIYSPLVPTVPTKTREVARNSQQFGLSSQETYHNLCFFVGTVGTSEQTPTRGSTMRVSLFRHWSILVGTSRNKCRNSLLRDAFPWLGRFFVPPARVATRLNS